MGLPFVAVVARETLGGRTVLLTEMPTPIKYVACLAGLVLGCVVGTKLFQKGVKISGKFKATYVAIAVIALGVVTFSYLARWAFEIASFADLQAETQPTQVKIMEVRGGKSGTFAEVRAFPDSREIDVSITNNLWAELASIRPPLWSRAYSDENFCLKLPLQHGRWGAVRAFVPALWDDGLNDYEYC